jgi:spermidine synthase
MPNGTTVTEIFSKDSFYGNLKVVEYSYGPARTRELLIDGLVQGAIDMNNGLSIYEYAYFMEYLPYNLNPDGKNCLVIGLGAGVVPMWYDRKGIRTDVVDWPLLSISPGDFRIRHFRNVIIAVPGISKTAKRKYDYVVLDVFNGDTTGTRAEPSGVQLIKERMSARGILAINLVGSLEEKNLMTASVVKTLESVFPTVDIYPAFAANDGNTWGNLAIIAYAFPRASIDPAIIRKLPVHAMAREGVEQFFERTFSQRTRPSYSPML